MAVRLGAWIGALAIGGCGGRSHDASDASGDAGPAIDCLDALTVPAGTFTMGRVGPIPKWMASGDPDCFYDTANFDVPAHEVTLSSFRIQRFETTVACFKECVEGGGCGPLDLPSDYLPEDYFTGPEHRERPVYFLTKSQAVAYCSFRGGRLPTEAEWERAARGTDGRIYPVGDDVGCEDADVGRMRGGACCEVSPCETSDWSYSLPLAATERPGDLSPYGVHGMTGGVSEWVSDIFDSLYYMNGGPPWTDPQGPTTGHCESHLNIERGGCFLTGVPPEYTATTRHAIVPEGFGICRTGVRCAWDE